MPLKRLLIVALVALMVGGAGLGGCNAAQEVSLEELLAEPESYDSEDVIVEGFYFSGFEVNVLAEGLVYLGLYKGPIFPIGRLIWIEGSIDTATMDSLYGQPETAKYPTETFGKIRIEGKFEYGEAYGHLGNYDYQIIPVATEALEWSPEELGPPPTPDFPTPRLETIPPQAAFELIKANLSNPNFIIIDVRGASSFDAEHIENAINIDFAAEDFAAQLGALDKNGIYLVYCAIGRRSASAGETMASLGFTTVYVIEGGIEQWKAEGLPTITPDS